MQLMGNVRSLALAAFLSGIAALLSGCERRTSGVPQAAAEPAIEVKVTRLSKGEITRSINLPGEIKPYQSATLFAKVSGYLKTISVDKGDSVKEGALLAEIEVPELMADRAKYKS